MTVIVALKQEDRVWIGADGRITHDTGIASNSFIKWRSVGGLWWAASGNVRLYTLADLSQHVLSRYKTCLQLCEALRNLVKDDDWSTADAEHGEPIDFGFSLLATDGDEILRYSGSGAHVSSSAAGDFTAIGSGADYALGSLCSHYISTDKKMLISRALGAAMEFDPDCGGERFITEVFP